MAKNVLYLLLSSFAFCILLLLVTAQPSALLLQGNECKKAKSLSTGGHTNPCHAYGVYWLSEMYWSSTYWKTDFAIFYYLFCFTDIKEYSVDILRCVPGQERNKSLIFSWKCSIVALNEHHFTIEWVYITVMCIFWC